MDRAETGWKPGSTAGRMSAATPRPGSPETATRKASRKTSRPRTAAICADNDPRELEMKSGRKVATSGNNLELTQAVKKSKRVK